MTLVCKRPASAFREREKAPLENDAAVLLSAFSFLFSRAPRETVNEADTLHRLVSLFFSPTTRLCQPALSRLLQRANRSRFAISSRGNGTIAD